MITDITNGLPAWLITVIVIASSVVLGVLLRFAFLWVINFYAGRNDMVFAKSVKRRFGNVIFLFVPLLIIRFYLAHYHQGEFLVIIKLLEVLIVISLAVLVAKSIYVIQDLLFDQYDISKSDNLKERKAITQIIFLRKLAVVVVVIISFAIILLNFEGVRKYGATMLTSAGVAGIIIGFAAQKTLSNLFAGIQIAFSQPIKIDDAVVVEGEWGWVEEINLTYAVVRIWDMRRLVLPITYFTENTFQNWTRSSAQIMGSVFLYVDYSAPLDDLRKHFEELLEESPLWDKAAKAFQITDTSEKTMTIRMLMTAKNSPEAFDLRCYVREEMLKYIQQKYPKSLPKTRAILES